MAGDFGIDAKLDSLAGWYCLTAGSGDVEVDREVGARIAVARDAAIVATLTQGAEVEVSVQGSSARMNLPSHAWDTVAEATIEVSQPLHIVDGSYRPAKAKPIPLEAGTYLMQVYARSPETIERQRPQQTQWREGKPWPEEHFIIFSMLSNARREGPPSNTPPPLADKLPQGVLFDEVVQTDYGQFDLTWDEDGGFDGDFDRFFAHQENGLVGAADARGLYLNLARRSGGSAVQIVQLDGANAPDLAAWEDVVEVSITIPPGATPRWMTWAGEESGDLPDLSPGSFRVRVSARGRDAGRDGEFEDEVVDFYLIELWPQPPSPDAIIQSLSRDANYWHGTVGSRR